MEITNFLDARLQTDTDRTLNTRLTDRHCQHSFLIVLFHVFPHLSLSMLSINDNEIMERIEDGNFSITISTSYILCLGYSSWRLGKMEKTTLFSEKTN